MSVKSVLDDKGSNVVTIASTDNLMEAAEKLAEWHIGALVVTGPDDRVAGILSERDIVWAIAKHGDAALSDPVSEFMTRTVVSCTQKDTVQHVMGKMTAGRFRHMPVFEQKKLIGIISIGDVVKRRLEEMEREQADMQSYIRSA